MTTPTPDAVEAVAGFLDVHSANCEAENMPRVSRRFAEAATMLRALNTRAHPAPEASAGGVIDKTVFAIAAAAGGKCWEDPGAIEALRIAFKAGLAHAPGFHAARDRAVEAVSKEARLIRAFVGRMRIACDWTRAGKDHVKVRTADWHVLMNMQMEAAAIQPQGERGEVL